MGSPKSQRLFGDRRSDGVSKPMPFQKKSRRERYIVRNDDGRGRRTWSRLPARSVLLHTLYAEASAGDPHPSHSPSASFSFFAHTKNSKHRKSDTCCFGRGRRDRTLNTRFWRPMLYQLSYTPIIKKCLLWWTITDSNRGPTGYEPVAVTN